MIYAIWAPAYDTLLRFHPVSRARASAFAAANIDSARRVLLDGVGTGADLEFVDAASVLVGIDLSRPMLVRAIRKADRIHRPFVPVHGDAVRLPFHEASFDAVILTLFVSVVPDPQGCLMEALRVLRPGGRILVLDKFLPRGQKPSWARRLLNLITCPMGTDINRSWEELSDGLGKTVLDEAYGWNGSLRTIVIEKA